MRVTVKDLEAVCQRINRTINGTDATPRYGVYDSEWGWYVGVYHLDGAYGGWCLHRTVNKAGGVTDVFGCGHVPKRELYDRMQAFLRGVEAARKWKK